jgi:hypothetical protein
MYRLHVHVGGLVGEAFDRLKVRGAAPPEALCFTAQCRGAEGDRRGR